MQLLLKSQLFACGQLDSKCRDDCPRHVVLKIEDTTDVAVIAIGPDVRAAGGFGQLSVDPDPTPVATDTSGDQV